MSQLHQSGATHSSRNSRSRRRWAVVFVTVLVLAAAGYWKVTEPMRLTRAAQALLEQRPDEAERLAAHVVEECDPKFVPGWLVRSRALLRLGRKEEALGCFGMIDDLKSSPEDLLIDLASDALKANQSALVSRCIGALNESNARSLRTARLLLSVPNQSTSPERFKDALLQLEQATTTDVEDWGLIANARRQNGDIGGETQALREAVRNSKGHRLAVSFQRRLAQRLIQVGEFAEARPLVDEALLAEDRDPEDRVRLATILRAEGQRSEAIEELDKLLSEVPRYDALLLRATLFEDEKRFEEAAKDLAAAVRRNALHAESHYRLAQTLHRLGRTDEANKEFAEHARLSTLQLELLSANEAVRSTPNDLIILQKLIDVNRQLGNVDAASQWQRTLQSLKPSS